MQTRDRIGQQFGNYHLVRLIGSGGWAEVYLAEHVRLNSLVCAIKVLTGTNLLDEQREQFLAEARTIANLQKLNSHIVQIHDFDIQTNPEDPEDKVPYIAMEYAAGGTLRQLYPHKTQVPLERIVFYTNQVAEALQCAHDQNPPIVHRDIKPENMLLRNRDHLLLSDFGIAMTGNTTSLGNPMKEKEILGTVAYMAPERLAKRTRRASDQYALAVVVYEWLCGSLPFDGIGLLSKQLVMPPPPLYPQYPHITKEIENVVMRALSKEPADRYPRVQDFAQALEIAIQKALLQNQSTWPAAVAEITLQGVEGQPLTTAPPRQQEEPSPMVAVPMARPTQQRTPQGGSPTIRSARRIRQEAQKFFEPQYARAESFAIFRISGIILNVLSAITIGLLERSNYFLFGGLIFSLGMFMLCIYLVEEKLALLFGTTVALYWGFAGWETGSFLASLLNLNQLFPSLFMGAVFFGASLSLHIWYISRKNL